MLKHFACLSPLGLMVRLVLVVLGGLKVPVVWRWSHISIVEAVK